MISISNVTLFVNNGKNAEFNKVFLGKEAKLADLAGFEKETGWNVSALNCEAKTGESYIRLSCFKKGEGGQYGALFPLAKKNSDKSPDMTGFIGPNSDTRTMRVSGWFHDGVDGKPAFISLKFSPYENASAENTEDAASDEVAAF